VRSMVVILVVLVGCASAASLAPHNGPRREAAGGSASESTVTERRPEAEPIASDSGDGRGETVARAQEASADSGKAALEPETVEGEVFAHCAYGPPNYGEDPGTDSKEGFTVVVLGKALPEICPTERGEQCVPDVVMFHLSTRSDAGVSRPESLIGRRVRLAVSEYQTAMTGHHHSRIVLWYSGVQDLGPASQQSLRTAWPSAKRDFLGTSCKGFPR
jgi:hypothetical protein